MEEWSERCNIPGFEDAERGPQAKEYEEPLGAGEGKEVTSPLEPPERTTAGDIMSLAQ